MSEPGQYVGWDMTEPPGLTCLTAGHIFAEVRTPEQHEKDPTGPSTVCWCIWCGSASYDEEAIDGNDQPIIALMPPTIRTVK